MWSIFRAGRFLQHPTSRPDQETSMISLFALGLGPGTLIILLILGVLFFGRRLPELARNLGKGILEFKKGVKGLEDDVPGDNSAKAEQARPPRQVPPTVPKFDDHPR
jgi:sec-independent protein translocase protein TatA